MPFSSRNALIDEMNAFSDSLSLNSSVLFTSPEGWVADYTGSDIAAAFPTLERFPGDVA